jgi:hypothetical protein
VPRLHAPLLLQIPVQEGDVIILATDGLFDNLWEEQVGGGVGIVETGCAAYIEQHKVPAEFTYELMDKVQPKSKLAGFAAANRNSHSQSMALCPLPVLPLTLSACLPHCPVHYRLLRQPHSCVGLGSKRPPAAQLHWHRSWLPWHTRSHVTPMPGT